MNRTVPVCTRGFAPALFAALLAAGACDGTVHDVPDGAADGAIGASAGPGDGAPGDASVGAADGGVLDGIADGGILDGAVDVGARDGGADGPPIFACTTGMDCFQALYDLVPPPGMSAPEIACCVHDVCIAGQGAVDALDCSDANVQRIQASSYDQSCDAGTDCTAVFEGDLCGGPSDCSYNAAINTGALVQYQADVARTNAGRCISVSSCGFSGVPCCQNGSCVLAGSCE
jgi:hypothetical protein